MRLGLFLRAFAGFLLCSSVSGHADNLVIWNPVEIAPNNYQTTLGFRLPMRWEASAGADLGLASTGGGSIVSGGQTAAIWGRLVRDRKFLAANSSRALDVRVDMLTGVGSVSATHSRDWLMSSDIDVSTSRSIKVNYAESLSRGSTIDASQSLALTYPALGTSVSASGSFSGKSTVTGVVAVHQPISSKLDFNASLTDPLFAQRSGDVRFDYRVRW